jgi:hypothetical protein
MNSKSHCICSKWLGIAFFLLTSWTASAQQPGGVTGTQIWYVTKSDNNGNTLKNISGYPFEDYANSPERIDNLNINFHPATFINDNNAKLVEFPFLPAKYTLIGIVYPGRTEIENQNSNYFKIDFLDTTTFLKENQVDKNAAKAYSFGNPNQRTTLAINASNSLEKAMKTVVYYRSALPVSRNIWRGKPTFTLSSDFTGYLPELIYYNRVLNPLETAKVNTYLAIKYGTTLDTAYVGSDGKTLWDGSAPTLIGYNNRVCAIGSDTLAALKQPKSTTTYEDTYKEKTAYDYDANSDGYYDGDMVPRNEQSSLDRSLIIGFPDSLMTTLPEKTFLFWGDNGLPPTLPQPAVDIDHVNYPGLLAVNRRWLMYNNFNIQLPTKIEVAGLLHANMYNYYDYEKYRYVLILFKDDMATIDKTILFDYFGRQVFRDDDHKMNFYNNKIVWNNIKWTNTSANNKHVFTFGRVPLMRFYKINDNRVQVHENTWPVWVKSNTPITPVIEPDNMVAIQRPSDPVRIKVTFTAGVAPYHIVVQQKTAGGLIPVSDVFLALQNLTNNLIPVDNPDNTIQETDQSGHPVGQPGNFFNGILHYDYTFANHLLINSTYVITLTDKINQQETITVTTALNDN